jgi:hypothetical protein
MLLVLDALFVFLKNDQPRNRVTVVDLLHINKERFDHNTPSIPPIASAVEIIKRLGWLVAEERQPPG